MKNSQGIQRAPSSVMDISRLVYDERSCNHNRVSCTEMFITETSYSNTGYVLSLGNFTAICWILRPMALLSAKLPPSPNGASHNVKLDKQREKTFTDRLGGSDLLQYVMGSSMAQAALFHQVSWKAVWQIFMSSYLLSWRMSIKRKAILSFCLGFFFLARY